MILAKERIEEIHHTLMADGAFHCHETVDYSGDEPSVEKAKLCVGAALYLNNVRQGGFMANLTFRLAFMFGNQLKGLPKRSDLVHVSKEEFIKKVKH